MQSNAGRRAIGVVLVATLLSLAGCNGLALGESATTPAETVTAVPVDAGNATSTATRTAGSDEFGWLVRADGTVELGELFGTHSRRLSNTSYTLVWTRRTVGGSGPLTTSFDRRIAIVNDTVFSRRQAGSTVDGVARTFADGRVQYRRFEAANGSTRYRTASTSNASYVRSGYAVLGASDANHMLSSNGTSVRYVERDGTRYAQLFSGTAPEYLHSIYSTREVRNFTATAWVHPDGYIRTVFYEFTLVEGDDRITIGVRYTYTDVGETTVDRPPWVERIAANESGTPGPGGNGTAGTATAGRDAVGTPTATPDGTPTVTPD